MPLLNAFYDDEDPYGVPSGPPPVADPAPVTPPVGGDLSGGVTVPPVGQGGDGGGGGGSQNLPRPTFNFGDAPQFVPPQFRAPSFEDAQNTPGYQFRLNAGSDALERSAAARGVLRTGGTLKDITEYGQNFASGEYGNVYNQALAAHDRNYRGAWDAFQPRLQEWQFLSGAELQAALAQFNAANQRHGGGGGGYQMPPPMEPAPASEMPGGTMPWPDGSNEWRKPGWTGPSQPYAPGAPGGQSPQADWLEDVLAQGGY